MKSLGLFLLRLIFGSLIALHGYPKLFGGQGKSQSIRPELERVLGQGFTQSVEGGGLQNVAGMVQSMNMPAPQVLAGMSGSAEFFGGLALILGWHTRLASLALLTNMGVAIRKVHWNQGILAQGGAENALTFFAAFLTLLVAGPGKISLDRG